MAPLHSTPLAVHTLAYPASSALAPAPTVSWLALPGAAGSTSRHHHRAFPAHCTSLDSLSQRHHRPLFNITPLIHGSPPLAHWHTTMPAGTPPISSPSLRSGRYRCKLDIGSPLLVPSQLPSCLLPSCRCEQIQDLQPFPHLFRYPCAGALALFAYYIRNTSLPTILGIPLRLLY